MRVLVVEDEGKLAKYLKAGLEQEGFAVDCRFDGLEGQKYIESNHENLDVVLLDLMLPLKNGIEVCKAVRENNIHTPILMLTARSTTEDKIQGFGAGADDYLAKPFSFEELLARIRAIVRRPKGLLPAEIKVGNLVLDPNIRKAFYENKELSLTLKEFNLLEYFMEHPNQVLTREQIVDKLWDFNFDSFSNVVDVHVKNLRKKIEASGHDEILETIRGVGYRLKG